MKVYPKVGEETVWTPTGAGATVETLVSIHNAGGVPNNIAQVPVRMTTSNELTKSGQARTVIKLEARLNAQLAFGAVTGNPPRYNVGANGDVPVTMHIVVAAPRGAIQLAADSPVQDEGGLKGLVAFMFRTLVTLVTNRSSDAQAGEEDAGWNASLLLKALKGMTAYDPVSGSYGQST